MKWLLFLSRLAFICGIFLLLSFSLTVYQWTNDEAISSTVVMIGQVMGLVFLPFVNLCYLGILFTKTKLRLHIPSWLIVANILFLFTLAFYIFYLNDPYYHQ